MNLRLMVEFLGGEVLHFNWQFRRLALENLVDDLVLIDRDSAIGTGWILVFAFIVTDPHISALLMVNVPWVAGKHRYFVSI